MRSMHTSMNASSARLPALLLLAAASCGEPAATLAPPSVDVSGPWAGTLVSTTPRGDPVYGAYLARLSLLQTGAQVSGTYATDIGIGGRVVSGYVTADRVTLSISTSECAGTLQLTGTVRQPEGGAAEVDVTLSGQTDCAGEREDRGTLVHR